MRSYSATPLTMTLAVNQGLLDQLNEDEIQGVLGHEIGHIRHKDSIIMTFMSAIRSSLT